MSLNMDEPMTIAASTQLYQVRYCWTLDVITFLSWSDVPNTTLKSSIFGLSTPHRIDFKLIMKHSENNDNRLAIYLKLLSCGQLTHVNVLYHLYSPQFCTASEKPITIIPDGESQLSFELFISDDMFGANIKEEKIFCDLICFIPKEAPIQIKLQDELPSSLSQDLSSFRSMPRFTDITLVVGGKQFEAHRVLLAARSSVFETMFHFEEYAGYQKVVLNDVKVDCFEAILDFIYTDEAKQIEEMAEKLLIAAKLYDIKGLVHLCAQHMSQHITTHNVCQYFSISHYHNLTDLKHKCIEYITDHATQVMTTKEYTSIIASNALLMQQLFERMVNKKMQITAIL